MIKFNRDLVMDKTNQLALKYLRHFRKPLVIGAMPLEDYLRLEEIVEECIRDNKPYDNYLTYAGPEGTTQDSFC